MKKICFVNINAYSLFNPKSEAPVGGTEVQLFNVANYLSKRNDVDFIVGDWGQKNNIEQYKKIKVYKSFSLEKNIWNYIKAPFILWKQMKQINAKIYIASSAGVEIGIIALFCKIKNKKFIFRTASSVDCTFEKIKKLGLLKGFFYKYGLRNANAVVVQSEQGKNDLLKYHKKDSVIIKNAFLISDLKEIEKDYILWVGSARKVKQPDIFLKLCQEFPQEKFVMIMPKSTDVNFWDNIFQKAEMVRNLKFIERVSFNEIQNYFDKAKLLIGTSKYEGFPNVYLQSCMGRTPIISLRVNPDKFITKNNLGYCANGNFSTMVDQIKNILSNQKDWQEKSNNALKYVQKNHDIKVIGEKWAEIIDNLKQEKY